jgi:hypothetical protein
MRFAAGAAMNNQQTIDLITECRDALAEELGAWDIDPPLHHIKAAHDKCVAWLDDHTQQAEPVAVQAEDDLPDRLLKIHRTAASEAVAKWQREQAESAVRESQQRARLNLRLAGRKKGPSADTEFGVPHLAEDTDEAHHAEPVLAEPVAWVDERAISWLDGRRNKASAHITTRLSAAKSLERPMALYTSPPQQAEPVAWLSIDSIGERYLCFSKPLDNDPVFPLYAHPPQQAEPVSALQRYRELETDPEIYTGTSLERLRIFCSLAMGGLDWLDAEPFFDDAEQELANKQAEPVADDETGNPSF